MIVHDHIFARKRNIYLNLGYFTKILQLTRKALDDLFIIVTYCKHFVHGAQSEANDWRIQNI